MWISQLINYLHVHPHCSFKSFYFTQGFYHRLYLWVFFFFKTSEILMFVILTQKK